MTTAQNRSRNGRRVLMRLSTELKRRERQALSARHSSDLLAQGAADLFAIKGDHGDSGRPARAIAELLKELNSRLPGDAKVRVPLNPAGSIAEQLLDAQAAVDLAARRAFNRACRLDLSVGIERERFAGRALAYMKANLVDAGAFAATLTTHGILAADDSTDQFIDRFRSWISGEGVGARPQHSTVQGDSHVLV